MICFPSLLNKFLIVGIRLYWIKFAWGYLDGLSVQIMHIGSYDDEGPCMEKLHQEFIPENCFFENGKLHEIYNSDPRRVATEKLKTILGQPVRAFG